MKRSYIQTLTIATFLMSTVVFAQRNKATAKNIEEIVSYLSSDELEGRDTGSEGLEKAARYIERIFRTNSVQPYFENYRDEFEVEGQKTFNVVGFIEGQDKELAKEVVILGAHFDHIGKGKENDGDEIANGANDNAAGSAAVIALAKYYAKAKVKKNKRSILFVLFGAEEKGLLGSKHLAKVLKDKDVDVYSMINFEMIGVPLQNKEYQAYITGYEMSNMASKMNEYAGQDFIGFLPEAKKYNLFKRSDNYPFYKAFKVPAQTISTFDFTNYQYYHHVDDEAENLDFEFMADFINQCIPVLTQIFNTADKEIELIK